MLNTGFGADSTRASRRLVDDGRPTCVTFGRPFLANPDLVERWRSAPSSTSPTRTPSTAAAPQGYTDYPALSA